MACFKLRVFPTGMKGCGSGANYSEADCPVSAKKMAQHRLRRRAATRAGSVRPSRGPLRYAVRQPHRAFELVADRAAGEFALAAAVVHRETELVSAQRGPHQPHRLVAGPGTALDLLEALF